MESTESLESFVGRKRILGVLGVPIKKRNPPKKTVKAIQVGHGGCRIQSKWNQHHSQRNGDRKWRERKVIVFEEDSGLNIGPKEKGSTNEDQPTDDDVQRDEDDDIQMIDDDPDDDPDDPDDDDPDDPDDDDKIQ